MVDECDFRVSSPCGFLLRKKNAESKNERGLLYIDLSRYSIQYTVFIKKIDIYCVDYLRFLNGTDRMINYKKL